MVSCKKVEMKRGEMNVYDFGDVRLHAYQTNDPIADEVFILEKAKKAVVIELPVLKTISKSSVHMLQHWM